MTTMFFAGIPVEGGGARPLEADLYGAEPQGVDHENMSATGNLNIGTVMEYDEHAQQYLSGAGKTGDAASGANFTPGRYAPAVYPISDAGAHNGSANFGGDNSSFMQTTNQVTPSSPGVDLPTHAVAAPILTSSAPDTASFSSSSNVQNAQSSSETHHTFESGAGTYITENTYNNYNTSIVNTMNVDNVSHYAGNMLINNDTITIDNPVAGNSGIHHETGLITDVLHTVTATETTVTNTVDHTAGGAESFLTDVINHVGGALAGAESSLQGITSPLTNAIVTLVNDTGVPSVARDISSQVLGGPVESLLQTAGNVIHDAAGTIGAAASPLAGLIAGTGLEPGGLPPLLNASAGVLTQNTPLASGAIINATGSVLGDTSASPATGHSGLVNVDTSLLSTAQSGTNPGDGVSLNINTDALASHGISTGSLSVPDITIPLPTASSSVPIVSQVAGTVMDTGNTVNDAAGGHDSVATLYALQQAGNVAAVDTGVLFTGGSATVGHDTTLGAGTHATSTPHDTFHLGNVLHGSALGMH